MADCESCETVVFADQHFDYRIPALLYVKEWSMFLAFAEKRTDFKDQHAKNLVMRRGIRQQDGTVQWSPTDDLMAATQKGFRTMNPCPVFEKNSKDLFLFFVCLTGEIPEHELKPGQSRLCYVTSSNCGITWSRITDLTDVIVSSFPNYQTFDVGPGHGIQLTNGTLLIPAYVQLNENGSVNHYSVVLRSQDHKTWQVSQRIAKSGECQVAEVSDGEGRRQVYLNGRSTGKYRVEALSNDGGVSFTLLTGGKLSECKNGCQGSVLAFPVIFLCQGSQETALLFSHPTTANGYIRQDLGLYIRNCLQDQISWGDPLVIIHPGTSGYSDLTHCEQDGHFACLMESKKERLQIDFREFQVQTKFVISI